VSAVITTQLKNQRLLIFFFSFLLLLN